MSTNSDYCRACEAGEDCQRHPRRRITRKLLLECNLAGCGHHFECWTETDDDGSWSVHFHAPCPEGKKLAREIAVSVAPGKAVTIKD